MSRATPAVKRLAEQLLRFETVSGKRAARNGTEADRACEKLRLVLSPFLGSSGFWALVTRALALARAEVPEMSAVVIKPDGSFDGWSEAASRSDGGKIAQEEVILIAHLLGLLVVFIGANVTLRLVQDAWPKARLEELRLDEGDN